MSNTRFTSRKPNLDFNVFGAVLKYFEDGGNITVCAPGRRSKNNISFPRVHGTISNRGAKKVSLTSVGIRAKG